MLARARCALFALLFASAAHAADRGSAPMPDDMAAVPWSGGLAIEAPQPRLRVGDCAPDFSFLDVRGEWRPFRDLVAEGAVVMVFGARPEELTALEQARPMFADLGVNLALVLEGRVGSAWRLSRRLGISDPLVTDPRRAIGDLYGSLEPRSRSHAPAFFVIDRELTVRAMGVGLLPAPRLLLAECARGLGRPLPASAWSYRD